MRLALLTYSTRPRGGVVPAKPSSHPNDALRAVRALSDGQPLGATPSFDKLLLSTSEKFIFDAALEFLPEQLLLSDSSSANCWRKDYMYARAASIYGGAAEVQRDIVAERVLGMPRGH